MAKLKLTGKQLRTLGFPNGPVVSQVLQVLKKYYKWHTQAEAFNLLKHLLQNPAAYAADEIWQPVAKELVQQHTEAETVPQLVSEAIEGSEVSLNQSGVSFAIFGSEGIEQSALHQMYSAAKLPVAVAGALMPDAHHGYGLPIGGVLATENAVIPYGVGVDIGCRMCLSIFDLNPKELETRQSYFAREINEATLFGSGAQFRTSSNHEVMENKAFSELNLLKSLKGKAWKQLGSSGSGNHFVEFGIVDIPEKDEVLGVPAGQYIGLLSHSGSRALGANIAAHYTKLAKQHRRLPQEASNLAWLHLSEEAGVEYWIAMNLAGDYASACHHIIHEKIARQLGRQPLKMVENHHNFAWKEQYEGREMIVHRKGATPAGAGVLGIIPGSMTAPGFIVKGKGEASSVNSASHGAGRLMSRTAALKSITPKAMKDELEKHGVKLMGGGLDEAPFAYKNIETVMQSQQALVDVVGKFTPKIVKMAGGDAPKPWQKPPAANSKEILVEGE